MIKTLLIIILTTVFVSAIAQNKFVEEDSLFNSIWDNPEAIESKSNWDLDLYTYRYLGDQELTAIREYYGKGLLKNKRGEIKRQYISYYYLASGFSFNIDIEKWFSETGELTHMFNHTTGIQLYGENLPFLKFKYAARKKADSIVQTMFTKDFYKNHIPFCSECVIVEYKYKGAYLSDYARYFEIVPINPKGITFHYPIIFDNTLFRSQINITFDTSLNIIESHPNLNEINNYAIDTDFNQAYKIADSLGYIDDSPYKHDSRLIYNDSDYYWVFPKVISTKEYGGGASGESESLIINTRTLEISREKHDWLVNKCD